MIFEGDKGVIDAIKEKKRLMEAGEAHGHIRPLLIIGGGLMRGVFGGAAVTVLYEEGYGEVFDDIIGISSGAPTAAYFLGGNPRVGNSIYYDECCSDYFLKATKLKNWIFHPLATWRDAMDLDYLDAVFRGSTGKPIDDKKVFKNRTRLHIAVTKEVDAESWYINTCIEENLRDAVIASCDIPGANSKHYEVEGQVCVDGLVGEAFPLTFIEKMDPQPTHVMVLPNAAGKEVRKLAEVIDLVIFNGLLRNRIDTLILKKWLNRHRQFQTLLDKQISSSTCAAAVIWTDSELSLTSTNKEKLKAAAERSEAWWRNLLNS